MLADGLQRYAIKTITVLKRPRRRKPPGERIAGRTRAFMIALALFALILHRAAHAQVAPPIAPAAPSQAGPRPPLPFTPPLAIPAATPTGIPTDAASPPSAVPFSLLPTTTATPQPAAQKTPNAGPIQAQRIHGSLTLVVEKAGVPAPTLRRGYEIVIQPSPLNDGAPNADAPPTRRLRLWASGEPGDMQEIAVFELDHAVLSVADTGIWSVHARGWQSPLAQALQSVLEMAAIAVEQCSPCESEAGTVDAPSAVDAQELVECTLVNSGDVATFLTERNPDLRAQTTMLVAEVDADRQRAQRYLLTAELASEEDADTVLRVEWTYALDTQETEEDDASATDDWAAALRRLEQIKIPGFADGTLPAPEHIVAIEGYGKTVRILFALPKETAVEAVRTALRAGGWDVEGEGHAFSGRQGHQSIIVLANDDAVDGAATVDLIPIGLIDTE